MTQKCCLAGVSTDRIAFLTSVLSGAGLPTSDCVMNSNIAEVAKMAPTVLVCDLDALRVDRLERLRQLRFVLPGSTIAVYTGRLEEPWAAACHLAGASCVLSKESSQTELSLAILVSIQSGCFTDPRFRASVKATANSRG